MLSTIAGTLLLFVTFTQSGGGGATQYLVYYLPILLLTVLVIGCNPGLPSGGARRRYIGLVVLVLLASLSTPAVQYSVVLILYSLALLSLPLWTLLQNLPTYAYYAVILNLVLYLGEVILRGQLGLPFDPTVFNYMGVDREGVITTWGFNRYAAHHTEPGSFAINLGALSVLSLMGDRKPTTVHWIAVMTLASTLSITAAAMAAMLTASIFLVQRMSAKKVLLFVVGVAVSCFVILKVLPLLGLLSTEFLVYRIHDRGGDDGSIYVKQVLIEDVQTRDLISTIFGNRHEPCWHCGYSKSLGYGFYMVFNGGLLGAAALVALAAMAIGRLGRKGLALFLVFMLMRVEFYFPQAMMMYLAIAGLPYTKGTSEEPRRRIGLW